MPRTVYYLAATLDGFIADEDDGLEWLTGFDGATDVETGTEVRAAMNAFDESHGALAMGSATYEWILGHASEWPYAGKPTWVFTSRDELEIPDGADVRFVSGEVGPLVGEMIAAAGERDLWVVGGGALAADFARAGRLDEIIVTVVPVVLGSGKPLFGGPLERTLHLTGCRPFTNGMVELRYAVRD